MNNIKITDKLEKRFQKIESYILSDKRENKSCSELFATDLGRKLGTNIDKIRDFSVKGILTIFPFESFFDALKDLYNDVDYLALVNENTSNDEQGFINFIKNDIIKRIDSSEVGQLFNTTDERVFLGALTTSIYSLIDGYTQDALALIVTLDNASSRILKNLGSSLNFSFREVERILDNPGYFYGNFALEEAKTKGVITRLKLIKSGTGIWDSIESAVDTTELRNYEQHFKDFIDFRNLIAHGNPIPTTSHFLQNELIMEYINIIENEFKKSMTDTKAPPEMLSKLFEIIMTWLNNRQTPIGILMQLTSMAVVYPAIIDNSISVAMNL